MVNSERTSGIEHKTVLRQQLAAIERPSLLAQKLRDYSIYAMQDLLYSEYDVVLPQEDFTPTYFFAKGQRTQVSKITREKYTHAQALYHPELDAILQFELNNEIADSHLYWHEQWHSMGHNIVLHNNGKTYYNKVGHSTWKRRQRNVTERGLFLEEAVVDWLAAKSNVLFWHDQGVEITERASVEALVAATNYGEYLLIRDAFRGIIINGGKDIEKLLIQTRFAPHGLPKLSHLLHQRFGLNTTRELQHLTFNPDELVPFINTKIAVATR